jgi:transcriptional regulator with XRE-family HTH domain
MNEPSNPSLSHVIVRYLINIKKWTPQKLADKMGVNKSTISRVRSGKRDFSDHMLRELSKAANMSIPELILKAYDSKDIPEPLRDSFMHLKAVLEKP